MSLIFDVQTILEDGLLTEEEILEIRQALIALHCFFLFREYNIEAEPKQPLEEIVKNIYYIMGQDIEEIQINKVEIDLALVEIDRYFCERYIVTKGLNKNAKKFPDYFHPIRTPGTEIQGDEDDVGF